MMAKTVTRLRVVGADDTIEPEAPKPAQRQPEEGTATVLLSVTQMQEAIRDMIEKSGCACRVSAPPTTEKERETIADAGADLLVLDWELEDEGAKLIAETVDWIGDQTGRKIRVIVIVDLPSKAARAHGAGEVTYGTEQNIFMSYKRHGVEGLADRACIEQEIGKAIQLVLTGGEFTSPTIRNRMRRRGAAPETEPYESVEHPLSPEEQKVAKLIVQGQAFKKIKSSLHKSIHTAKNQAHSVYRKLQAIIDHLKGPVETMEKIDSKNLRYVLDLLKIPLGEDNQTIDMIRVPSKVAAAIRAATEELSTRHRGDADHSGSERAKEVTRLRESGGDDE